MKTYLVVHIATGNVVNRILLNDETGWTPPEGYGLVEDVNAPPAKRSVRLSPLEFKRLFTQNERMAIISSAQNETLIAAWLDLLNVASEVDLQDEDTVAGLHYLEAVGLIAHGRAAEILNS